MHKRLLGIWVYATWISTDRTNLITHSLHDETRGTISVQILDPGFKNDPRFGGCGPHQDEHPRARSARLRTFDFHRLNISW